MVSTHTNWKLKPPAVALSQGETEWFEWALDVANEVLDDEGWLADNDDALTISGQLEDMRYRLEEQGEDVAETNCNGDGPAQIAARRRTLRSLMRKLEASAWFTEEFHA